MKKTLPSFDLGIDHLFPSEPEERKQKKEEQLRAPFFRDRVSGGTWSKKRLPSYFAQREPTMS